MKNFTALIVGATGLVGSHCLHFLLNDPDYILVKVLTRRALNINHPKLQEHRLNFEKLAEYHHIIKADHVFCCLGTTIKQAGNQDAFRRVDFDYAYQLARMASQNNCRYFLLVSALGANEKSKIFYNRVKGELEKVLSQPPFQSTLIFRPSLLLGQRRESRPTEKIGEYMLKGLTPFLVGKLKKYRPIQAHALALAMVEMAKVNLNGIHIFESDQIQFFYEKVKKNIERGIIPSHLTSKKIH